VVVGGCPAPEGNDGAKADDDDDADAVIVVVATLDFFLAYGLQTTFLGGIVVVCFVSFRFVLFVLSV